MIANIRAIWRRLRLLWRLSGRYEADTAYLQRQIDSLTRRVGDATSVNIDAHRKKPSVVITIGEFRGRDYIRIFPVESKSLPELVEVLKALEPQGHVGRFDVYPYLPIEVFYARDRL